MVKRRSIQHLLLQTLSFFDKQPRLLISETARVEIGLRLARIADYEPVATLLWVNDNPPMRGEWALAFYDMDRRPCGRVVRIEGMPFFFCSPDSYSRLDGAAVDLREGKIVVTEKRIGCGVGSYG